MVKQIGGKHFCPVYIFFVPAPTNAMFSRSSVFAVATRKPIVIKATGTPRWKHALPKYPIVQRRRRCHIGGFFRQVKRPDKVAKRIASAILHNRRRVVAIFWHQPEHG